jgi:hypothetical protein
MKREFPVHNLPFTPLTLPRNSGGRASADLLYLPAALCRLLTQDLSHRIHIFNLNLAPCAEPTRKMSFQQEWKRTKLAVRKRAAEVSTSNDPGLGPPTDWLDSSRRSKSSEEGSGGSEGAHTDASAFSARLNSSASPSSRAVSTCSRK